MKTYVIAGLHGDEPFGLKVLNRLQKTKNPSVRVRVGHPEALERHVRYLETDINRSFTPQQNSLEARLARKIQTDINDYQPDYIIDIHTSISNVKSVAIVAKHTALTEHIARTIALEAIVIMPQKLVATSLIGNYPEHAVSIEYGKEQLSDTLVDHIATSICTLNSRATALSHTIPIFEVTSIISKDYQGLKNIKNLAYNDDLNGYPFLAGEDTYPDIGGFLAKRIQ